MKTPPSYEKANVFTEAERFNNGIVNLFMDLDGYECFVLKQDGLHDFTHINSAHDELIVVMQGEISIILDGETVELSSGDMLKIPSGVEHKNIVGNDAIMLLFEMKD